MGYEYAGIVYDRRDAQHRPKQARAHSGRGNYAAAEADGPSFPSIDKHAAIADRLMCGPIILVIAARLG